MMSEVNISIQEGVPLRCCSTTRPRLCPHSFGDESLAVTTGLVPIVGLAHKAVLPDLADDRLIVITIGAD